MFGSKVSRTRTGIVAAALLAAIAPHMMASQPQEPGAVPETAAPSVPPVQSTPAAPSADSSSVPTSPAASADATVTNATIPNATEQKTTPAPKTYTVPAGTKVLLTLQSSINTKSAKPGDGVYLMSAFPVIVGNRVLIPAGMYVQGMVDTVERHIRIKGHAKLNMHFTSMIFPNGSVIEIPGVVNSIPGSKGPRVKEGGEGTVEQTGGAGEVATAAGKGAAIGAGGGVLVGAAENHPFEGIGVGGAAGAVVGAAVSLFTHGNDIDIVSGSQVEMVLQRPLILQESNLTDANSPQFVPAAQRQPMPKPDSRRVLCPIGSPCQN